LPADPGAQGNAAKGAAAGFGKNRVSLQASNIPMLELFRYVAGLANLQVKVERTGLLIVPQKR
jgi:hypothetical protein